jgi:hypothetical protein
MLDPNRMKLLKDCEDPNDMKSTTLMVEPHRVKP